LSAADLSAAGLPAAARAAALLRLIQAADRPVVLIDGGSGSGKTTLAAAVAPALGAQLVRLDDIYPGWDGLDAASEHVREFVLDPVRPRWRRWDWVHGAPAEWHDLDPSLPLVVEGSGSLSRANRAAATWGIWVDLDAPTRKARALDRDGEVYARHWDRWAAQERRFAAREHPSALADVVLGDDVVSEIVEGLAS
jgi:energy-coupling factor transporter ATP-binding protein EcfA2